MIIDGSYLPGGITYILGTLVLVLLHTPITLCLAHIIYSRRQQLYGTNSTGFVATYCHLRHFFFIFFITCHILFSLNFYFAYGLMAYLLGFFNTWSYVVYIILWHQSVGLSAHSFPEPIRPKYRKTVEFDDRKETQSLTRPPIRK
ncbi:unnamed protein product [Medioppia subpectinata]|uniref:Uncharacterized protein n=1 Tax=Medioppia subpectinata TaxID=1979941 RepID=A0A7R9LMU1_9ACAR|nr:unnamed protein product [Medioppia subpectinata]CAG2119652.1 unnamed protein product [Medioppia subpectinata]